MKNILKKIIIKFIIMILCITMLLDCKNNVSEPTDFEAKISGVWIADEIVNGNCSDISYPYNKTELFSVIQNGTSVEFVVIGENDTIIGTVSGNKISWQVTKSDGGEEMKTDFSGTISTESKSINGSATWIWTNISNGSTCNGITTINARKAETPSFTVNGKWEGDWQSSGGSRQGTFETNIIQDNFLLSGTIDIPGVFSSLKNLKGVVSGSEIIFGDIDNDILFSGELTSNAESASGTYSAPAFNNNGNWQSRKKSDSLDQYIVVLDSVELSNNCNGDITFDGIDFWCISHEKIYRISTSAGIIDSIDVPGSYPQGLAYDGNHLLVGDGPWGLGKIFKLDKSGESVIKIFTDEDFPFLTFDGNNIWGINGSYGNLKAYKLNNSGAAIDSFNCPGDFPRGLAFDGVSLRLAVREFWYTKIYRISLNGDTLDSIIAPSSSEGLTFDGANFWYTTRSDNKIIKMDTSGNILNSYNAPGDLFGDITFDGTDLWCICGNISSQEYNIYKIDLSGTVISNVDAPGEWSGGLCFDGTFLKLSDNVTNRIYAINPTGESYFDYPNTNDINYLTTTGSSIWSLDKSNEIVTQFDYSGSEISSFNTSTDNPKGFVHDGSDLWIVSGFTSFAKLTKLNISGNIITEYTTNQDLPEPISLTYDGNNLWYIGGENWGNTVKLYKLGIQ